jgi:hypothetical protein
MEISPIVIICFERALTYRPRLKRPTSTSTAITIDTNIESGKATSTGNPSFVIDHAATYAPNADITPCAKLVVNDVRKMRVIAIVTMAVTHIGIKELKNVLII